VWALAGLFVLVLTVRWGWRRGWFSPRAELRPGETVEYRIDLNRAGEAELALLPGIGEVRAASIVAFRREHGPLVTLDDLLTVPGISESLLQGLEPYVTPGPADQGELLPSDAPPSSP
jgi:competence ComEA-like helix-hairpin-helix protein